MTLLGRLPRSVRVSREMVMGKRRVTRRTGRHLGIWDSPHVRSWLTEDDFVEIRRKRGSSPILLVDSLSVISTGPPNVDTHSLRRRAHEIMERIPPTAITVVHSWLDRYRRLDLRQSQKPTHLPVLLPLLLLCFLVSFGSLDEWSVGRDIAD
jgi:hypothetical protein